MIQNIQHTILQKQEHDHFQAITLPQLTKRKSKKSLTRRPDLDLRIKPTDKGFQDYLDSQITKDLGRTISKSLLVSNRAVKTQQINELKLKTKVSVKKLKTVKKQLERTFLNKIENINKLKNQDIRELEEDAQYENNDFNMLNGDRQRGFKSQMKTYDGKQNMFGQYQIKTRNLSPNMIRTQYNPINRHMDLENTYDASQTMHHTSTKEYHTKVKFQNKNRTIDENYSDIKLPSLNTRLNPLTKRKEKPQNVTHQFIKSQHQKSKTYIEPRYIMTKRSTHILAQDLIQIKHGQSLHKVDQNMGSLLQKYERDEENKIQESPEQETRLLSNESIQKIEDGPHRFEPIFKSQPKPQQKVKVAKLTNRRVPSPQKQVGTTPKKKLSRKSITGPMDFWDQNLDMPKATFLTDSVGINRVDVQMFDEKALPGQYSATKHSDNPFAGAKGRNMSQKTLLQKHQKGSDQLLSPNKVHFGEQNFDTNLLNGGKMDWGPSFKSSNSSMDEINQFSQSLRLQKIKDTPQQYHDLLNLGSMQTDSAADVKMLMQTMRNNEEVLKSQLLKLDQRFNRKLGNKDFYVLKETKGNGILKSKFNRRRSKSTISHLAKKKQQHSNLENAGLDLNGTPGGAQGSANYGVLRQPSRISKVNADIFHGQSIIE